MSPIIPTTGRIGKLAKTIEEETSKEGLDDLFQDYSNSLQGKKLAKWVLNMIDIMMEKEILLLVWSWVFNILSRPSILILKESFPDLIRRMISMASVLWSLSDISLENQNTPYRNASNGA